MSPERNHFSLPGCAGKEGLRWGPLKRASWRDVGLFETSTFCYCSQVILKLKEVCPQEVLIYREMFFLCSISPQKRPFEVAAKANLLRRFTICRTYNLKGAEVSLFFAFLFDVQWLYLGIASV